MLLTTSGRAIGTTRALSLQCVTGQIAYNDQDEQTFTSYSRIQMSVCRQAFTTFSRGLTRVGHHWDLLCNVAVEVVAAPADNPMPLK